MHWHRSFTALAWPMYYMFGREPEKLGQVHQVEANRCECRAFAGKLKCKQTKFSISLLRIEAFAPAFTASMEHDEFRKKTVDDLQDI